MTEPQSPRPPVRYNSAVLGALMFVAFNIVLVALGNPFGREAGSAAVRSILFVGNLAIPFVALSAGRGRFAAGWAMGIGVLVVGVLGLCFFALGRM